MTPDILVAEVGKLFTLPEVALRINELAGSPSATVQSLTEVIQLDPGLAATLLKIANSAYYGFSGRIDSVSQAITLVGMREIQGLAMAASATQAFKGLPAELVDMYAFWDQSVTCGVIARELARRCRIENSERLFIAGLLHAVGKLVFYATRPAQYREVLQISRENSGPLIEAEKRIFGFDHAELGAKLLAAWRLPDMLQTAVACQHAPDTAGPYVREASIVHVASDVSTGITPPAFGATAPEDYIPAYAPAVWRGLGLDDSVLDEIIANAPEQAFAIMEIVNPNPGLIF